MRIILLVLMRIYSVSQAYRGRCQEQMKGKAHQTDLSPTPCRIEKGIRMESKGGDSVLSSIRSVALGALSRDLDSTVRVSVIDGDFLSDGDGTGTGTDALD